VFSAPRPEWVSCRRQTMSALAEAFAESGRGILTGMVTRPRSPPCDPMTLGNMRANGVRSLDVNCWQCHHRTILSAQLRCAIQCHRGTGTIKTPEGTGTSR
jgi:ribosomal protein S27E